MHSQDSIRTCKPHAFLAVHCNYYIHAHAFTENEQLQTCKKRCFEKRNGSHLYRNKHAVGVEIIGNLSESCLVSYHVEGAVTPVVEVSGECVHCNPVPGVGGKDGEGCRGALEVGGIKASELREEIEN